MLKSEENSGPVLPTYALYLHLLVRRFSYAILLLLSFSLSSRLFEHSSLEVVTDATQAEEKLRGAL